MEIIRKALLLDKSNYYQTHLNIINCILPVKMTPKEIEVLAAFMSLEGDIAQYKFGPSARKIVMAETELSPAGLSNFIKQLTTKGFLTRTGDMTVILPLLVPEHTDQWYQFKLTRLN